MASPRVRTTPFLSIVIPVYNEVACLGKHLDGIVRFLEAKRWVYEILVVDDGSTDRTLKVISDKPGPAVRLLSHDANLGKGAAVRTGVEATTGTWVLITDADLSTPIEEAERLLAATEGSGGADIVMSGVSCPRGGRSVARFGSLGGPTVDRWNPYGDGFHTHPLRAPEMRDRV